ncbi:hypothetical protein CM15mP43_12490 [bacterium]|nr:MAG: hypothetical protein CM15mP43_12490 [bacterium]
MNCSPGLTDLKTLVPCACFSILEIKDLTTLKLTSASMRALRTSRTVDFILSSVIVPNPRTFSKNILKFFCYLIKHVIWKFLILKFNQNLGYEHQSINSYYSQK